MYLIDVQINIQQQKELAMEQKEIISYLRCADCGSAKLTYEPRMLGNRSFDSLGIRLSETEIECKGCSARYPITEDSIPLMWSTQLKEIWEDNSKSAPIKANQQIYDAMSDDYQSHTRRDIDIKKRIRLATERIMKKNQTGRKNEFRHLDYGCGPGHVLEWTAGLANVRIGLDVSLENLRNARSATGAMVVLGDAENMPFKDGVFDIVTESSVLHHIQNWKAALGEACRVCAEGGGVIVDSEPSSDQLNLSWLARKIFDSRWHVYHLMSYVAPSKHQFRNIEFAKKNYWEAEIHNQPGKGFDPEEMNELLKKSGLKTELIMSPNEQLISKARHSWKHMVLQITSMQNPWDPKNGSFTLLGYDKSRKIEQVQ